LFIDPSHQNILNFDEHDFENLDNFDVEERVVKEMLIGLESIILNIVLSANYLQYK